jgi:myo-inositol-1-phosphate synthase
LDRIRIAIVGVGNCASSLVQGIHYYRGKTEAEAIGLMHWDLGGYTPGDVDVVAAFDVDQRKVGADVSEAIFAKPNCTAIFCKDVPRSGVIVRMGPVLDGVAEHMAKYPPERTFIVSNATPLTREQVVKTLRDSGTQVMLNYLPVGSEQATRFYAECAIEAGAALVNNIPVFIASDPVWAAKFARAGLPVIGDDIKAQVGATITHRTLIDLFRKRGVKLDRTYQLNTGGNTDFLNMVDEQRLASKRISKTEAAQSVAGERLEDENIHIGPSDYVPWQNDNKVCFIRMEGRMFGDVPLNIELRLSVEDSPNSAGVAIDAIRCAKLALDHNVSGPLEGPASYFCKHPPKQFTDEEAHQHVEDFIAQYTGVNGKATAAAHRTA